MAINQFIFDGNASSPREVARKRALAAQIMGQMGNRQADTAMGGIGNALASLGQGFSARMWDNAAGREERAGQESGNEAYRKAISGWMTGRDTSTMPAMGGRSPMMPPAATETPEGQAINDRVAMAHSGPSPLPSSFLSAVDSTEGAGAYDTLYGHAQRDKFAGTDISRMPIRDVLAFSDPSGAYAQHVKGQIGRVATPMGRHQIVGTTLRNAVAEMGLDPNQPFDAQTQDAVAAHLARRRLASAGSMPEKISALRSEWHGFKSVPDNQMMQIVSDLENGGSMGAVNAMASGQPQAQADPAMAQQQPVEVAQASGGVPVQELMQALANPFLSQEQKSVLSMMLEQEMQNQDPMRSLEMQYKQAQINALNAETAEGPGAPEYGLTPQTGIDENGNPVLIQLAKDGTSIRTPLPDGVTLSKEPIRLDAGTHFVLLDPITRQPVGQIPKENYQEAFDSGRGSTEGKAQGEATANLSTDLATAEQALTELDQLIQHPGIDDIAGPLDQYRPTWTMNDDGRDALARFNQARGRAFLQAFSMLKGGGQITEVEGLKAEQAMARMDRAQSEEDFKQALQDFRDAVATGMDKMRQRAGGGITVETGNPPAQSGGGSGGYRILGVE